MSCADIQDSLVAYLLHELEDADAARIADHLAGGCPTCEAELGRTSASMSLLWRAVPSQPFPDSLRSRILAKCSASPHAPCDESTAVTTDLSQAQRSSIRVWCELLLAFAAGVLLIAGLQITLAANSSPNRSPIPLTPHLLNHGSVVSSLGARDTPDSLELSAKRFKKTRFVALHSPAQSTDLNGQLLWDRLSREIHIYCFGLAIPPADMQYTLWLVGPRQSVRILNELKIDERGECRAIAPWPPGHYHYIQVVLSRRSDINRLATTDIALTSDALPSNDF